MKSRPVTSALIRVLPLLLLTGPTLACGTAGTVDAVPEQTSDEDLQRFEYTQVHMGVQARIVLYAPDSSSAKGAAAAAFDRIAELDAIMSDYRPDSELMQLVNRSNGRPVRVSEDLFRVLLLGIRVAQHSEGAFDVSIGPLVRLWRVARRAHRLPTQIALSEARSSTGGHLIELDSAGRTVTLLADDMSLDLGGIAKGYAADEALVVLRQFGVERAFIEFGGDIVAGAPPPGRAGWTISVPMLDSASRELVIAREAISTSGDTEQYVEIDGTRYSHVLDPRTGVGLTDRVAVTVVADRAVLSDVLATALSVMGQAAGTEMLAEHYPDVRAYFRRLGNRCPSPPCVGD